MYLNAAPNLTPAPPTPWPELSGPFTPFGDGLARLSFNNPAIGQPPDLAPIIARLMQLVASLMAGRRATSSPPQTQSTAPPPSTSSAAAPPVQANSSNQGQSAQPGQDKISHSGQTAGAPPGYRAIKGQVPPGVAAKAKSLLNLPMGTEVAFVLDGKRYMARLEHHYHPPGFKGGPNGWHKGCTVYEASA